MSTTPVLGFINDNEEQSRELWIEYEKWLTWTKFAAYDAE